MHVSISGLFCETSYSPATILLEMVSGDDQFTRIQEEETAAEAKALLPILRLPEVT
jgi:hypothetical protein